MLWGFLRQDGQVGIRNYLLIISSVVCANRVTELIAQAVPGAIPITHQHGCAQIGEDMEIVFRTLEGTGKNPNVGAVLVVGLGCESVNAEELAIKISKSNKMVDCVSIQKVGGTAKAIEEGIKKAKKMLQELKVIKREPFGWEKIILGTECGGSDTTSGIAANPAVGRVADRIVKLGGTVILSETTEIIGAEHILAKRAVTNELGERLIDLIKRVEERYSKLGVDFRGGNPAPGNVEGGITTLEEKSLGAIHKAGTSIFQEILDYAQKPSKKGLVIMDTPGHDVESMTGMVAGGCQVILFTTGRGTPTGHPICPVIKITGNPQTWEKMQDDIDINASPIVLGEKTLDEIGEEIFKYLIDVINGKLAKAEVMGHREFGITRISMSL
ncbi:altronate dehydratase large subunit [Caldanaerovirga acetigignens]|uniref:Altronate dehydratase large subunit n=1 Tax=Caldanaerovirga acetigignens TaxID=447595 RepID=A0A1M7H9R3_9FIRM|nr:UxaA family hydrolase [Caldanaerovirga acetigignens]SHM25205.1 altronate dehydratase large subunit [Caldanaerovirga acetigignens]